MLLVGRNLPTQLEAEVAFQSHSEKLILAASRGPGSSEWEKYPQGARENQRRDMDSCQAGAPKMDQRFLEG